MPHYSQRLQLSIEEQAIADRLRRHVEILAGLIGPRHMGRPSSMQAAVAHVVRELEANGETVTRQSYEVNGQSAENLVLARSGVKHPEQIVILGAHYDTVPETPGADDNASAVAVLLEVARLLHGRPLSRTVRFVAFANEEPPFFYSGEMGSQVYAHECRRRGEQIIGMICLEMVGYFDSEPGSQLYPEKIPRFLTKLLPSRGNFIVMAANLRSTGFLLRARRGFKKAVPFPLLAIPLPERIPEIRLSDNGPFWDEGFPALMVTDTSFSATRTTTCRATNRRLWIMPGWQRSQGELSVR